MAERKATGQGAGGGVGAGLSRRFGSWGMSEAEHVLSWRAFVLLDGSSV